MGFNLNSDDKNILLKIQNTTKPDQVIYFVIDKASGYFETQGLKDLFGVKEIQVETNDVLQSLPEFAQVLSFLVESMSAAVDLKLPFGYQNEFDFGGVKYTLYEEGNHRVLRRAEQ